MRVLIAPDKFKGSLSAAQAAAVLAEGWPVDKPLEIERLPVADGGEGTAEAIHDALAGRWITLPSAIPSVGWWKAATLWLRERRASGWQCWR